MINKCLLLFALFFGKILISNAQYLEKKYEKNSTYEYSELIQAYESLANLSQNSQLIEYGKTDSGEPLMLFVYSSKPELDPTNIPEDKVVVLINNGIHAGESCGVDASLEFAEKLVRSELKYENVIFCIIPSYNIGGMLNRGCCTRANQNGPENMGFRGNAQNLDLNRDFIKADALNTHAFFSIFKTWRPHIFIDTHSTNGADYPSELTLIFSQPTQYHGEWRDYYGKFKLEIYEHLKSKNVKASEFVNIYGKTPDHGFPAFKETPIYSTGYTSSYGAFSIVSEAHMLKSYPTRVRATFTLIEEVSKIANKDAESIVSFKTKSDQLAVKKQYNSLKIKVDSSSLQKMEFEGFNYSYEPSKISGENRLVYHRDQPVTWEIDYYPFYKSIDSVFIPDYYVISKSWRRAIEVLDANDIEFIPVSKDTLVVVEGYRIVDYKTGKSPYEGHYPHSNVKVEKFKEEIKLSKNHVFIPADNTDRKFLANALEPHSEGSLFSWNYFDAILQQKEWYSSYVFEDTAYELLKNDPDLMEKFEKAKENDPKLVASGSAQLYWIYKHSKFYERSHMRYPVFRISH